MATYIDLREETTVIESTDEATAAPTTEEGYICVNCNAVRTFLNYGGTVTSCVIRMWVRDVAGAWYRAGSTLDGTVLAPAGGDEARDWLVGQGGAFTFQVESIAGGGTVVVKMEGIEL